MQRLNLNKKPHTGAKINLTEEDMQLFTGKQESSNGGAGYFSGDSLSSTPERRVQRPVVAVQEFVLNQARPKAPACDREMTPDSINNDQETDEQPQIAKTEIVPSGVMPCVEEGLSNDEDCENRHTLIDYEGQVFYEEEEEVDDDDDEEYEDYEEESAANQHTASRSFVSQVKTSIKNSQIQQKKQQQQERLKASTSSGGGGVRRVSSRKVASETRALDTDEETNNLLAASVNGCSEENCEGLVNVRFIGRGS